MPKSSIHTDIQLAREDAAHTAEINVCRARGMYQPTATPGPLRIQQALEWLESVSTSSAYADPVRIHATVLIKLIASIK